MYHTLSGTAAVLRSMLTKQQSQGPLPKFMRMQYAVPKDCNLIHALAPNTVPGTAAVLRTIFDQTVPGTVKTVPGDTAVVF